MSLYNNIRQEPQDFLANQGFDPVDELPMGHEVLVPVVEDLTIHHPLWTRNDERRLAENTIRNAYLTAWRLGAMGSAETLYALLVNDAIDFDATLLLISEQAAVDISSSQEGRAF